MEERTDPNRLMRRLPRYLLGLLESREEAQLRDRVASWDGSGEVLADLRDVARRTLQEGEAHPDALQLERLARGRLRRAEGVALLAHVVRCRDCRFELEILLADRPAVETSGSDFSPARPSRARRRLVTRWVGFAAALGIVLLSGTVGFRLGRAPLPRPQTEGPTVVELAAVRGQTQTARVFKRSDVPAQGIVFHIEAVIPSIEVRWSIVDEAGSELASGSIRFRPESPTLRSILVPAGRELLRPGAYRIVVRGDDGVDHRYSFSVTD